MSKSAQRPYRSKDRHTETQQNTSPIRIEINNMRTLQVAPGTRFKNQIKWNFCSFLRILKYRIYSLKGIFGLLWSCVSISKTSATFPSVSGFPDSGTKCDTSIISRVVPRGVAVLEGLVFTLWFALMLVIAPTSRITATPAVFCNPPLDSTP